MSYQKKIAESSLAVALIICVLLLENIIPYGRLSFLVIAGLIAPVILLRCGMVWALLVVISVDIIGLFLIPEKNCVLFYGVFFGWFPLAKLWFEMKLSRRYASIWKSVIIILFSVLISIFCMGWSIAPVNMDVPQWMLSIAVLAICVVYDNLIKICIQYYIRNISGRLK